MTKRPTDNGVQTDTCNLAVNEHDVIQQINEVQSVTCNSQKIGPGEGR